MKGKALFHWLLVGPTPDGKTGNRMKSQRVFYKVTHYQEPVLKGVLRDGQGRVSGAAAFSQRNLPGGGGFCAGDEKDKWWRKRENR